MQKGIYIYIYAYLFISETYTLIWLFAGGGGFVLDWYKITLILGLALYCLTKHSDQKLCTITCFYTSCCNVNVLGNKVCSKTIPIFTSHEYMAEKDGEVSKELGEQFTYILMKA